MPKPILILQVQRMGDLVLSFPLFLWLKQHFPGKQIYTVAEEGFYRQLMSVSPQVVYIPWSGYKKIINRPFSLVVNLSHRRRAAWLAGQLDCEEIIGPFEDRDGALRINGRWQLYRFSLVHNNRYNRFHWADLNALDVVPFSSMSGTSWSLPRHLTADNKGVGVFIGASQEGKRPEVQFWASLIKGLARRGLQPMLLGGPGEKEFSARVKAELDFKPADFTGRLDLAQLANMGQALQLLITPDTGPMHLASWTGMRVLNLSVGPVHPWETGPYQPGHLVLSPARSCRPCWECPLPRPRCRENLDPGRVAAIAHAWIRGKSFKWVNSTGNILLRTGRENGVYHLRRINRSTMRAKEALGSFWQQYWMYCFGITQKEDFKGELKVLRKDFPGIYRVLSKDVKRLLERMNQLVAREDVPERDFWKRFAPAFRPLSGYLQMYWQNRDYNFQDIRFSLSQVEEFIEILQEI